MKTGLKKKRKATHVWFSPSLPPYLPHHRVQLAKPVILTPISPYFLIFFLTGPSLPPSFPPSLPPFLVPVLSFFFRVPNRLATSASSKSVRACRMVEDKECI